jgi:hypothetical protein
MGFLPFWLKINSISNIIFELGFIKVQEQPLSLGGGCSCTRYWVGTQYLVGT